MDTIEELTGYFYAGIHNISAGELFFWVMVDETLNHLGVEDVGAVIAILSGQSVLKTRAKFRGATQGTSLASIAARKALPYSLQYQILPTITGGPIKGVKFALVNNLGSFVGRAVPVVGRIIIAYDISIISYKTTNRYNKIARGKDKLWN